MACYDSYGESLRTGDHVFHRGKEYTVKSVDDDAGVVYFYEVGSPFVARSVTLCTNDVSDGIDKFECELCGFKHKFYVVGKLIEDIINYCPYCGRPVHRG